MTTPTKTSKPAPPHHQRKRPRTRRPHTTVSLASLWLTVIVILPLAALIVTSVGNGPAGYWSAVTTPAALASFRVTITVSAVVALINAVTGTAIAWVLVRDSFPGQSIINSLIDLPFALPTIVASLVLLSLYGPGSLVQINGTQPAVILALLFVTLPFVVRSVQPVLSELDDEVEQAAASLGANNWTTWKTIVFPALAPSILSGAGLSFARSLGEYGSVVLIGGNIPGHTQVTSQYIQQEIESDAQASAAAVSVVLLLATLAILLIFRFWASFYDPTNPRRFPPILTRQNGKVDA